MTAASLRFRSVCKEDSDKVLNDQLIYTRTIRLFVLDFYARQSTWAAPSSTIAQQKSRAHNLIVKKEHSIVIRESLGETLQSSGTIHL